MKIKFQANGLDKYLKYVDLLQSKADGFAKRAVYDGAKVYGDAMVSAINALPTKKLAYMSGDSDIVGVTNEQKAGLLEGFGFAPMENKSGYIHTKAGFARYNSIKTKRFPKGQPNALVANAVNSGTSRRPKTGFIDKVNRASRNAVISAMSNRYDEDLKSFFKE